MASRFFLFLALPVLFAGPSPRPTASGPKPVYELKAELLPSPAYVMNDYQEQTRYVYFRVDVDPPRELWSVTRPERYVRHWISPQGRVWVAARNTTRLSVLPPNTEPTASSVWTRDAAGDNGGRCTIPSSFPANHAAVAGPLDLDRARMVSLYGLGFSEQLCIPRKGGGELRYTLLDREEGTPIMLERELAKDERDLLTEMMEDGGSKDLRLTRPVERSPIALWEGYEPKTGRPMRILQNVGAWSFLGDLGRPLPVLGERRIDLAPASVVRTPAGRVLWFGFSKIAETDAARLTVTSLDGTPLADVDLIAMGGYASSAQARARLRLSNLRIRSGEEWVPIESEGERVYSDPEEIELRDDRSRFLISIDTHGASVKRVMDLGDAEQAARAR